MGCRRRNSGASAGGRRCVITHDLRLAAMSATTLPCSLRRAGRYGRPRRVPAFAPPLDLARDQADAGLPATARLAALQRPDGRCRGNGMITGCRRTRCPKRIQHARRPTP